jgi:predicted Zn-dependent protease
MMQRILCLCLFPAALATAQANFYSLEKEQALGRQLAEDFRRHTTPLDSPRTQAYLNDLGQRLAAHVGGPPFLYTFGLITDDPTVMHEPASLPGGYIFVPAGLILAAKDEDELAGMLAHAIAHVATRDSTRDATRAEMLDMMRVPLVMTGGWTGWAMQQGYEIAMPVGMAQMRRKRELAADRLAVQGMAGAGYDPAALARYLERAQPAALAESKMYSPFPDRAQRLATIRTAIGELPAQNYARHPGFDAVQAEVRRLMAGTSKPPALAK